MSSRRQVLCWEGRSWRAGRGGVARAVVKGLGEWDGGGTRPCMVGWQQRVWGASAVHHVSHLRACARLQVKAALADMRSQEVAAAAWQPPTNCPCCNQPLQRGEKVGPEGRGAARCVDS